MLTIYRRHRGKVQIRRRPRVQEVLVRPLADRYASRGTLPEIRENAELGIIASARRVGFKAAFQRHQTPARSFRPLCAARPKNQDRGITGSEVRYSEERSANLGHRSAN